METEPVEVYDPGLEPFVEYLDDELAGLWDDLAAGKKSLEDWYVSFLDLLAATYTAAYLAGAKRSALEDADIDALSAYIGAQAQYLDNFRFEIQSSQVGGVPFAPGWRARARMYAAGIAAPYWRGVTRLLPLPAMPGDGTTQCVVNCKCRWEVIPLDEDAGDYDAYWRLGAADHCQTCLERAALWNPLPIRGGRVIISYANVMEDVLEKEHKSIASGNKAVDYREAIASKWISAAFKHLPGRHNQKRHGWRYGGDAQGRLRRQLESEPDELALYEQRIILRSRYTSEQVRQARALISRQTSLYLERTKRLFDEQKAMSDQAKVYLLAREKSTEAWQKYRNATKKIEDELETIANELSGLEDEYRRVAYSSSPSNQRKSLTLQRKINRLRDRRSALNEKMNSERNVALHNDYTNADMEAEIEKDKTYRAIMNFGDVSDAHARITDSFIQAIEPARDLLIRHYSVEAERVRNRIVGESKRWAKLSERAYQAWSKKVDEYRDFVDGQREKGKLWREIEAMEQTIQMNRELNTLHQKYSAYRAKAKSPSSLALIRQEKLTDTSGVSVDQFAGEEGRQIVVDGVQTFAALAGANPFISRTKINIVPLGGVGGRAYFSYGGIAVNDFDKELKHYLANKGKKGFYGSDPRNEGVKEEISRGVVHELGHALEAYDPIVRYSTYQFFLRRTRGYPKEPIYGDLRIGSLDFTEYGVKDRFIDHYMGKTYVRRGRDLTDGYIFSSADSFSEIVSVGAAMMYSDPVKLATQDPDTFRFIYSVLRVSGGLGE